MSDLSHHVPDNKHIYKEDVAIIVKPGKPCMKIQTASEHEGIRTQKKKVNLYGQE